MVAAGQDVDEDEIEVEAEQGIDNQRMRTKEMAERATDGGAEANFCNVNSKSLLLQHLTQQLYSSSTSRYTRMLTERVQMPISHWNVGLRTK